MKGNNSVNLHKPLNHQLFCPSHKAISPVLLHHFNFLCPFVLPASVAPVAGPHASSGFSITLLSLAGRAESQNC